MRSGVASDGVPPRRSDDSAPGPAMALPAGPTGYAHPEYPASLAEFGTPRRLPRSGGWILVRPIERTRDHDAMGCYPLFTGLDWRRLPDDLEELAPDLVSLAVVTDPFADCDAAWLLRCFPDRAVPFKRHFVADLERSGTGFGSRHHRYYARRALTRVRVESCVEPARYLDEWTALYATLCARHGLRGIKAFSRASFARQLGVPGLLMLRAVHEGEMVAAHLWYVQGEVAYSHLAAASERGYALMAAYAIHATAFEIFRGKVRWIHLGAGAGIEGGEADGLARFKQGWATGTRTAYFCGRVFDRRRYEGVMTMRGSSEGGYFPAYRAGEFE